ncbi:MAG TPA: polysaccharide deacetylase family protein [Alphaproteobacteria bacterium]|nr:polysaccharide deacetylase family protein [Alphaproteobacteria bacterium]
MKKKILSFGYDDERPYGNLADTDKGREFRSRKMDFMEQLNQMFDDYNCPRTFFILGQYLDKCTETVNISRLREIYNKDNSKIDIQQHSYSHPAIRKIAGRDDKIPMNAKEFAADITKASNTIESIIGVRPYGLRTPLGYPHDLSDLPELVNELRNAGITYVSSDLRSISDWPEDTLNGPLTKNRQPHNYKNIGVPELIEIPSHGLQDVVFTEEMSMRFLGVHPWPENKIFDHYNDILIQSDKIDAPVVSVALCLHPWAVMEYDKNLNIHKELITSAKDKGFEIKSYSQVADMFR